MKRRKVRYKGDWARVQHVMTKPCFADEHFAQTALAAAGARAARHAVARAASARAEGGARGPFRAGRPLNAQASRTTCCPCP